MARLFVSSGFLSVLMGIGLVPPIAAASLETGAITAVGVGVLAAGCMLIGCGLAAILTGMLRPRESRMPSGVRAAVMANALFLAFCALEFSDGLLRQGGRVFYWTTTLFAPALVLFGGLVMAQR